MAHVAVIVLGDLGRSPRMQYHANSISSLEFVKSVTLIGYTGELCFEQIEKNPKIKKRYISNSNITKKSFFHTILKGIQLCLQIFYILINIPTYDAILIQNPPSLPVAIVAFILSYFYNSSTIIMDWHNLGYTMYKGQLKDTHLLVRLYKSLESCLYFTSDYHLCVSQALKQWLKLNFYIDATVVYDRPPMNFNTDGYTLEEKHYLLMKLGFIESDLFITSLPPSADSTEELTIHTRRITKYVESSIVKEDRTTKVVVRHGKIETLSFRRDRKTALIITSTSWTPDEDISMLINAIKDLDENMQLKLKAVVVITGKGPMKAEFESKIKELNDQFIHCAIRTVWLEPHEYPLLLSCADIGVCLHTSTSGLDLPMKVLDMFGCGVPVCAVDFPAISELVNNGINGIIFRDAQQLAMHLNRLLSGYPDHQEELQQLRRNIAEIETWETNWMRECEPIIRKALAKKMTYGVSRNRFFIAMLLALLAFSFSLENTIKLLSWSTIEWENCEKIVRDYFPKGMGL